MASEDALSHDEGRSIQLIWSLDQALENTINQDYLSRNN